MSESKKHSEQVLRTFRVIEFLAGHEFTPLSTGDVACQFSLPKAVATRTLTGATEAGWLEQTPEGRWRHSSELSRMLYSVQQMQPRNGAPITISSNRPAKYLTPKVKAALRTIELLAGCEVNPLRTTDIASAALIPCSQATGILQTSEAVGFAVKTDDGKWKTGRALVSMAISSAYAYQKALSRIENQIHNRTRSAW